MAGSVNRAVTKENEMALSNMLNEPRREITETAMGIGLVCLPVGLDYFGVLWLRDPADPNPVWVWMLLIPTAVAAGVVLLGVAVLAVLGCSFLVHAAGEVICDFLEDRGLYLRPRTRR
jgi:hypothetical protein